MMAIEKLISFVFKNKHPDTSDEDILSTSRFPAYHCIEVSH